MKLLFVVQEFRQGWGGAPESVRLMANRIREAGITADVFDKGRFYQDVGRLAVLPETSDTGKIFDPGRMGDYSAVLIAGPWQNPRKIMPVLKARPAGQKLFYLPRGGLADAEFRRPRDIKKIPYLLFIERRILAMADGVIFSSLAEQQATIRLARTKGGEHIVPDFVNHASGAVPPSGRDGPVTFSFLAEISPRKGLAPLVDGFVAWSRKKGPSGVRLLVGGRERPGSEGYLDAIKARARGDTADIEFLGPVGHADRDAFYGETDVMVVSSLFESYGLTVIEALAQGCALVAAPRLGALEFLTPDVPVTIACGATAADLEQALDAAFVKLGDRGTEDREAGRAAARAMIDAINRTALSRWQALLAD